PRSVRRCYSAAADATHDMTYSNSTSEIEHSSGFMTASNYAAPCSIGRQFCKAIILVATIEPLNRLRSIASHHGINDRASNDPAPGGGELRNAIVVIPMGITENSNGPIAVETSSRSQARRRHAVPP